MSKKAESLNNKVNTLIGSFRAKLEALKDKVVEYAEELSENDQTPKEEAFINMSEKIEALWDATEELIDEISNVENADEE